MSGSECADDPCLHGMQVHSVVFAASGTLLLCLVDVSSVLAGMRGKIRKAFPGVAGSTTQLSAFRASPY